MSAVDEQVVSGDVIGRIRCEEYNGAVKIFGSLDVAYRCDFPDPLPDYGWCGSVHRGEDVAGADTVDIDIETPPFDCEGFCHVHDAGFGSIVGGIAVGNPGGHRGDTRSGGRRDDT